MPDPTTDDQAPEAGAQVVEWRRFDIGERVRIQLSPECEQYHEGEPGRDAEGKGILVGHHASINGWRGTVKYVDAPENVWKAHRYGVDTDSPLPYGITGTVFAANELEPLINDDAQRPADGA